MRASGRSTRRACTRKRWRPGTRSHPCAPTATPPTTSAASNQTYRDTFHGKISELGFTRVAKCADCHGAHDILPASNPASMISPERRLSTCQQCHTSANANFVLYDPHADPQDRARNPVLYFTAAFMKLLLGGVFLFFGMHTLL